MTATLTMRTLTSPKLGDVSYGPDDVIRFPQGIPGFETLREFLLVTRGECEPFVFLTSIERPEVTLPLLPLGLAAEATKVGAAGVASLKVGEASQVARYAVVSIGVETHEIITNLRAPVVVNLDTRLGRQVILPDEALPVAAPLGA